MVETHLQVQYSGYQEMRAEAKELQKKKRAGAQLTPEEKERYKEMKKKLKEMKRTAKRKIKAKLVSAVAVRAFGTTEADAGGADGN